MQSPLLRSQRLTSPSLPSATKAALDARRPSINYLINPGSAPKNTTPRPTKTILDFLLDSSIESCLKQADLELAELESFPDSSSGMNEKDIAERSRLRIERANEAEKARESMVPGFLSIRLPPSDFSSDLQHRLYLAQLTNLVYSRFNALPSSTHAHHHLHSSSGRRAHSETILQLTKQNGHLMSQDGKRCQQAFETPISSRRCRRHRSLACDGCLTSLEEGPCGKRQRVDVSGLWSATPSPPPPGLIDAIPPFLKTSATALRRELEEEGKSRAWMPTGWYDLFLELLTQAAIESYFCDGRAGLEPILEIFAYGDADDEEPVVAAADDSDDSDEEEEEEVDDEQSLRAADHHLLFPKTKTTVEFAKRLRDREAEFFLVKGTLEEHFQALANKYPLQGFERSMRGYINSVRATLERPMLIKYEPDTISALQAGPGSPPLSSHCSSSGSGSASPSSSASTASTCSFSKGPIPSIVLISNGGAMLMPNGPDNVVNDDGKHLSPDYSGGDSEDETEGGSEDNDDDKDDRDDSNMNPTTRGATPERARRDNGSPDGTKRRRED